MQGNLFLVHMIQTAKKRVMMDPSKVQVWILSPSTMSSEFTKRTGGMILDLPTIAMQHYQRFTIDHWKTYIDEWLPLSLHVYIAMISYKSSWIVTGLAISVPDYHTDKECYIRLLCSACKCGRILMNAIRDNSKDTRRIALHSEPSCVEFYRKLGFVMVGTNYETNDLHVRYPMMILPLGKKSINDVLDGEVVCTWFYFGWWYYLAKYAKQVLFGCGVAVAIVVMKNSPYKVYIPC